MPRKTSKRQVKRRTKRKTMQRKRRKQFGGDDVFSAGQKVFYKNPELTKKGQYDIESAEVIEIKDGKMNIKIENSKITGRIGKTYEVNSENIQHSIDLGDFLDATKSDQVGGGNLINADNSQYSGGFGSNMGAVAGCVGCDGCGGQKGGGHSKIEAQNQMGPAGYGVHNLTRVDNISMQGSGYPVISAFNSAKQCFGGNKKVRKARKSRRKARKSRKLRKSRRKARRKKSTTKKN